MINDLGCLTNLYPDLPKDKCFSPEMPRIGTGGYAPKTFVVNLATQRAKPM